MIIYYIKHTLLSALEPRILTRWDMHKYAREAYNAGIRYIGGCCGYEPYHIRAVAEELTTERGGVLPAASEKHGIWGTGLEMHTKPWVRARSEETSKHHKYAIEHISHQQQVRTSVNILMVLSHSEPVVTTGRT